MFTQNFARYFFRSAVIIVALLLVLVSPAQAYFPPFSHQSASLVLGQPDFTSNALGGGQTGMSNPQAVAVDPRTHKVFVADSPCRVLRFASLVTLTNGAPAEAVLGEPDFNTSAGCLPTRKEMFDPSGLFVDGGGRLWVADSGHNRVLRFDNASFKANYANADGVLGQPNFTSHASLTTRSGMYAPNGVFVDASGRLWVADTENSRVLRFDNAAAKPNGANADVVLGQHNFTSRPQQTTGSGMSGPTDVAVDASGRLWVADEGNSRMLRFDNAALKHNGANANGVLGQPNFASRIRQTTRNGMNYPEGVAVDPASDRLFVSDGFNRRILVFNAAGGLANGADASYVLGQENFTTNIDNEGGLSAASLSGDGGWLFFEPLAGVLLTADFANNRILMYGLPTHTFSTRSVAAKDGWVLKSAQGSNVGGTLSTTGLLRVGDDAGNKQYRSILSFDTSGLPGNATIRSVTVLIHTAGVVGAGPFAGFIPLIGDIKNGSFGVTALETSDFQDTASTGNFGDFASINKSLLPWYRVGLPSAFFSDINLTGGVTQIRIRFNLPSNGNNLADYVTFYGGDAASPANRPILKVEYTVPIGP